MKTALRLFAALCCFFCAELHAAGSLKVTIAPAQAVAAGAQWRVDNGIWRNSAVTVNSLSVGSHSVDYKTVSGWIAPAQAGVTIPNGKTTTLTATYIQTASLKIILTPSSAQWRVNGGAWQANGATVTNLAPGAHAVDYAPVAGYTAPAAETVSLTAAQNTTLTRSYVQLASFTVSLTPTQAQWRLDNGPWQYTSTILNNLALGAHTVEFAAVEGYITPSPETVTLVSGTNPTLVRNYTPLASVTVTLAPTSAQWRLDGGSWQASGNSATNLAEGPHLIEFSELAGYTAPTSLTVMLNPGANNSYTFAYIAQPPAYEVIKTFSDAGSGSSVIMGHDGVLYGFSNAEGGYRAGLLFKIDQDGSNYSLLKNFGVSAETGHSPTSLVEGSDGMLYGTNSSGGSASGGTIYRINKDGTGYVVLWTFVLSSIGVNPNSLIEGTDGSLYGTTTRGGPQNVGVIFKINKDGSGYTVLKTFSGGSDGKAAVGLIEGPGGALYGTTGSGGASGFGVVFKLNNDGSNFSVLKTFGGGVDGSAPRGPLLFGTDGVLYGTTSTGGITNRGTLFRLNADGTGHAVIKNFAGDTTESGAPSAQLKEDVTGTLYGITTAYGPGGRGSVFRINKDGTSFGVVKTFTGGTADGGFLPFQNAPVSINNGVVYGVTQLGGPGGRGLMFRINSSDGTNFTVLKNFGGPDGSFLMTSVTEGPDGVLYGVTYLGGSSNNGTIFKVNKDGSGHAVLRNLTSTSRGNFVQGVIAASDNALYGIVGGDLIRINNDGTGYTVLRSFAADASWPQGVIEGSDGALYGTTGSGGSSGFGTVFKINKDGSGYAITHNFAGGSIDGQSPSILTEGANEMLYGTTSTGGSTGYGIVFGLRKDGSGYTVLKHFVGGSDGAAPGVNVIQGSDGLLYGTTTAGGSSNQGVIFKLATDGNGYAVLRSFVMDDVADQNILQPGVVEKNGSLYGVTNFGGTFNVGVVFTLKTDGSEYTALVNFGAGDTDGALPAAGLYQASDGLFYGTTGWGGLGSTIFRLRSN